MITKTGMYRTENLSHMDRLNLGCYGCGRCFVELKKKRKGRYQCFEQLYMNCSETEIHVREIKPPACDSFIPKKGPDGMWVDNKNMCNYVPCSGCVYGEKLTGGTFCRLTKDMVPLGYPTCRANEISSDEEQHPQESDT